MSQLWETFAEEKIKKLMVMAQVTQQNSTVPAVEKMAGNAVGDVNKEEHEYPPEGEAEQLGEYDPFDYFNESPVREPDNVDKDQHINDLIYDNSYYTSFE